MISFRAEDVIRIIQKNIITKSDETKILTNTKEAYKQKMKYVDIEARVRVPRA